MGSELKRRKLEPPTNRGNAPPVPQTNREVDVKASNGPTFLQPHPDEILMRIPQNKNFAVYQAQCDGSKGNYRIFDSAFDNFMVPVVPTRADLNG